MGGGFFDNMWDPYSGAYAYPRTQPRARYYRPRAPVYEHRPLYEQRGRAEPESHLPGMVKAEKTVRTIPVTDGSVASQPKVSQNAVVARFESEDVAARRIQAVYRGHFVRRTEPLKHLRVIAKVRTEFDGFKRRFEEREQRVRLRSDPQERLRWTEGVMALLLRLDQLQGVHPEVRLVRKAAAKELMVLQEKLDSMSGSVDEEEKMGDGGDGTVVIEEENLEDGVVAEEQSPDDNAVANEEDIDDGVVAAEHNLEDGAAAEEEGEVYDAAEEGARVSDDGADVPAAEAMEEMEVKEGNSGVDDGVEEAALVEADGGRANHSVEQDIPPREDSNDRELDSEFTETSTSEHDNHEGVTNCDDQAASPLDPSGESVVEDAEQDGLGGSQVPMDVENAVAPAREVEEVRVEADSPHTVPPMDVDQEEASEVNYLAGIAPPADDELMSKDVELGNLIENHDQSHDVGRGDQAERPPIEVEKLQLDTPGNNGNDPTLEQRAADAGPVEFGDDWMTPACSPPSELAQHTAKILQVGQPQVSTTGTSSFSDRALLEQLLEENRKLKDVVGKVLHWGKQQNDIIHSLASRIEQLEEHQPQSNMLHGEKINGRKRICSEGGLVGDRDRSLRGRGRRKGRLGNRPQLGYLDSEWLSAESDEYF